MEQYLIKNMVAFMRSREHFREFQLYMSTHCDMNDEELEEMINDIKADNDDY